MITAFPDTESSSVAVCDPPVVRGRSVVPRRLVEPVNGADEASSGAPAASVPAGSRRAGSRRAGSRRADWLQLAKPRIVVMITASTMMAGWIVASVQIGVLGWFALAVGTALVAASSGGANQLWERRTDGLMKRTAGRPLPAGRMSGGEAMLMTAATGLGGLACLAVLGWQPVAVAAGTWLAYVAMYTPLKRKTEWNTTVGAVAGALPVFIGTTATGGGFGPAAWALFAVLAAWQYPHFMAIAWLLKDQYGPAGYVMTTTNEPTGWRAAVQAIGGTAVMIAAAVWAAGWLSPVSSTMMAFWIAILTAAGMPLLLAAVRFAKLPGDDAARSMMRHSLLALPVIYVLLMIRSIS